MEDNISYVLEDYLVSKEIARILFDMNYNEIKKSSKKDTNFDSTILNRFVSLFINNFKFLNNEDRCCIYDFVHLSENGKYEEISFGFYLGYQEETISFRIIKDLKNNSKKIYAMHLGQMYMFNADDYNDVKLEKISFTNQIGLTLNLYLISYDKYIAIKLSNKLYYLKLNFDKYVTNIEKIREYLLSLIFPIDMAKVCFDLATISNSLIYVSSFVKDSICDMGIVNSGKVTYLINYSYYDSKKVVVDSNGFWHYSDDKIVESGKIGEEGYEEFILEKGDIDAESYSPLIRKIVKNKFNGVKLS